MGGSRQLYPFELTRPPISAPLPHSPYESSFAISETPYDLKSPRLCVHPPSTSTTTLSPLGLVVHGPYDERYAEKISGETYTLPPIRPVSPLGEVFEFETAGFIPAYDHDAASTFSGTDAEYTLAFSTMNGSERSASRFSGGTKFFFDFDSLPTKTLNPTSGPPTLRAAQVTGAAGLLGAVFGQLTQIRSPVVSRAQWEVVVRSMAISALVALIVVAVLVAAPI